MKIGIIGFGNMGSSLGFALKEAKNKVYIYDKDKKKIKRLMNFYICNSEREVIAKTKIIILAIKPQDVKDFLERNSCFIKKHLIISIAAGIPIRFFEKYLKKAKIIRVMPNLAAKIKFSLSFLSGGKLATKKDLTIARRIFSSAGEVIITKEEFIDKATAITGSGPGYVYYLMECLYRAALSLGFKESQAKPAVIYTFLGAANLALSSKKSFEALINEVASPKGTTEAGLKVFKKGKIEKVIKRGIEAAYQRAKYLSKLIWKQ